MPFDLVTIESTQAKADRYRDEGYKVVTRKVKVRANRAFVQDREQCPWIVIVGKQVIYVREVVFLGEVKTAVKLTKDEDGCDGPNSMFLIATDGVAYK